MKKHLLYFSSVLYQSYRAMSMQHQLVEFTFSDILKIVPKLSLQLHKGQCGRIGIIGGSREYTGAPYYAAITALRLGADLAHVFCSKSAGTAIKCYSPDLIVHPILDDEDAIEQIQTWLPRLHAVVIGPGLGREEKVVQLTEKLLEILKNSKKLTIIDADGLFVVTQKPELLQDFSNAIITPNEIEFQRLCKVVLKNSVEETAISQYLPDLTIVHKGEKDQIFNSSQKCVAIGGSARRCGGQGDILSGAIGLLSYWAELQDHEHKKLLGCYAACTFTKMLNEATFNEHGRSMLTSDMVQNIPSTFKHLFK